MENLFEEYEGWRISVWLNGEEQSFTVEDLYEAFKARLRSQERQEARCRERYVEKMDTLSKEDF